MGYHVKQKSAEFLIRYENFDAASQALIAFAQKTEKIDWVDKKALIFACKRHDFYSAMDECHWECDGDENGINEINYRGETRCYNDHDILNVIAPFAESGSYIEMAGENGDMWRWRFNGRECIEEKAVVIYETDPQYVVTRSWILNCECGVSVLGVTRDRQDAEMLMQTAIETEKRESWIFDVPKEDISSDGKTSYVEETTADSWSFFLNGCYCTKHIDIVIHTLQKEEEN